ncbi:MAG: HAMP domain-containing histidine kinase [Lachnospiraceae bacterium]|nr:HAMP domain-containing histidine kinase [Lachnospiraceae bacterium]
MKKWNGIMIGVVLLFLAGIILVNSNFMYDRDAAGNREYRVSINRIRQAVEAYEQEKNRPPDRLEDLEKWAETEGFPFLTGLDVISVDAGREELSDFLQEESDDYVILATQMYYYKVRYRLSDVTSQQIRPFLNGILVVTFAFVLLILCYIRQKILLPFDRFSDIPYELSKGNLTIPLQENRNRFFGRYIWGMDLLRENLEQNKVRELALQKEKKMLLLSLGHDIKTPLSAIKLYARAISKKLYQGEKKEQEIADNISRNVDEIESYLSEMIRASHEDFLEFEVHNSEFYIRDVLEEIRVYYRDKMALNQIRFEMESYRNCLVFGDADRLQEVLQNVIENAMKYGDGRRVWLLSCRQEEEYRITVSNTGCTLSERELPHIFDSFYRGSNVGKKPGSGLGLYICRQLLHQMEGEIMAEMKTEEEESVLSVHIVVHLV